MKKKVIIMGAAGRDFHNFNTNFRGNQEYDVVCFTATQIPDIDGRKYPAELAGELYPEGIPIHDETELESLIAKHDIDEVVFSYSDVPHEYIMNKASMIIAAGADFKLLSTKSTMLKSVKPVVSVCAVRTGCGKSQTTRKVCEYFLSKGKKVVAVRHPMPYGDLVKQNVQRFATMEDLVKHECTIEEREEYEPHIKKGVVVYAGVDYEKILREAEKEADVVIWDGGNNDTSFFKADLEICVADPHRPGHELTYFPGEVNFRRADVIVINKIDTADMDSINEVRYNAMDVNPDAIIIDGASPIFVEGFEKIKGKKVLVVEDGPTLTHGEMEYGAGIVAAMRYGAEELVDPRPYTTGTITDTFKKYPYIGTLLPAMGYGDQQIKDLEDTINATECDLVIIATPIDLSKLINIKKEHVKVDYELQEIGKPDLEVVLKKMI
ncbi:GTPase [bacterium]|nr:GTPase [bacterium]